jgi:hypothetical protein
MYTLTKPGVPGKLVITRRTNIEASPDYIAVIQDEAGNEADRIAVYGKRDDPAPEIAKAYELAREMYRLEVERQAANQKTHTQRVAEAFVRSL